MPMTPDEKRLLAEALRAPECRVTAADLLTVADMVRKGWVLVDDGMSGIWFRTTKAGVDAALTHGVGQ